MLLTTNLYSHTYAKNISKNNPSFGKIISISPNDDKNSQPDNNSDISSKACEAMRANVLHVIKNETVDDVNKKLAELGITSFLKGYASAKMLLSCAEDFLKLNPEYKDLFGFTIIDSDASYDFDTSDEIKRKAISDYNHGKAPTKNPKFQFYKLLGEQLCFQYSDKINDFIPYLYLDKHHKNTPYIANHRYTGSIDNSSVELRGKYIATKMCGLYTPPIINKNYVHNRGIALTYPPTRKTPALYTHKIQHFTSTSEAQNYLRQYGITSHFDSTELANLAVDAIEDYIEANDDCSLFNGLNISEGNLPETAIGANAVIKNKDLKTKFQNLMNKQTEAIDFSSHKVIIDFHKFKKLKGRENTYSGACLSDKSTIYHELAHWLDIRHDSNAFVKHQKNKQNTRPEYLLDILSMDATRENMTEFFAEYVVGKMAGRHYPKFINDLYLEYCNNKPFLYFPHA